VVAHDLHPDYLSTKYAAELDGVELVGVQHHHAHVAACLADNGETGPVIGVAFDGLGLGLDATVWGGEFLVADLAGFRRVGHLDLVPMPGGAAAIREPWAHGRRLPARRLRRRGARRPGRRASPGGTLAGGRRGGQGRRQLAADLQRRRLFDAVAAIVGVRDAINYEGQAAVELEQWADPGELGAYRAALLGAEPFRVAGVDLVRAVVEDLRAGADPAVVAARFHNGMPG
jgi:hydrogenase maturation protein HypF